MNINTKKKLDAQPWDLQLAINKAVTRMVDIVVEEGAFRNCLNCDRFDNKSERCKLAPTAEIPKQILVAGCEVWKTDEIPF